MLPNFSHSTYGTLLKNHHRALHILNDVNLRHKGSSQSEIFGEVLPGKYHVRKREKNQDLMTV